MGSAIPVPYCPWVDACLLRKRLMGQAEAKPGSPKSLREARSHRDQVCAKLGRKTAPVAGKGQAVVPFPLRDRRGCRAERGGKLLLGKATVDAALVEAFAEARGLAGIEPGFLDWSGRLKRGMALWQRGPAPPSPWTANTPPASHAPACLGRVGLLRSNSLPGTAIRRHSPNAWCSKARCSRVAQRNQIRDSEQVS